MSNWQTFLQNFFPLAEEIREKRFAGKYRAAVLIFTALAFSVLDVTPAGFVGNERQALAAYRQASIRSEEPPAVGQLVDKKGGTCFCCGKAADWSYAEAGKGEESGGRKENECS